MKKMLVVMFLLATVASAVPVEEETIMVGPDDPTPARIKAQMVANMNIIRYEGYIRYDFQGDQKYGEIRFDSQLRAEFIMIDGVVLYDEPENPTKILPRPEGAVENFSFYLVGWDRMNPILAGNFWDSYFDQDDAVTIQMEVMYARQLIEFDLPDHVNPDNIVVLGNPDSGGGPIGWYNQDLGMLEVWLDPDWGIIEYTVVDTTTGEVLAVGEVSPVDGPTDEQGFGVTMRIEEGIEIVDLSPDPISHRILPGRKFETADTFDGHLRSAKFFVLDLGVNCGDIWLHTKDFWGAVVAYDMSSGSPEAWQLYEEPCLSWNYDRVVRIPRGPEKMVVGLYYVDYNPIRFDVMFAKWRDDGGKG